MLASRLSGKERVKGYNTMHLAHWHAQSLGNVCLHWFGDKSNFLLHLIEHNHGGAVFMGILGNDFINYALLLWVFKWVSGIRVFHKA
jgi:hypothetical protein